MYVPDPARITYFAQTDARNKRVPFGIKSADRSRHMYVIGKTGMGKSTLLENMAVQDIQNGEGITFIDPHGSTAERLLDYIPQERARDVLYFAPFDLSYPISFNVMENVDPDKRHLVISGLMATFEKIWEDAWSARMSYILQNTIGALLEYPGATLLGINRMYIDKEYRKKVVENISDPSVRSFWVDEYTKFTDRYTQEATPAIQNKIGQFSSNPLIRNIIGQPHSSFDLRQIMDNRKIFIVNLSKGRVGEGNANLLGSMLITKIYLAAMSRADLPPSQLSKISDSYLYVDEFQSFANKSFADILSEARKYRLALTMAHQYIEQMEEEVRAAVFGNVGTMITFRVGAYDADVLEKEFAPVFMAQDLVNLGLRQIYLKLMIDGISSAPFSATTLPPIDLPEVSSRDSAIAFSRKNFSRPRSEVEQEIFEWHKPVEAPKEEGKPRIEDHRERRPRYEGDRPREARPRSPEPRIPERSSEDLRATLLKVAQGSEPRVIRPAEPVAVSPPAPLHAPQAAAALPHHAGRNQSSPRPYDRHREPRAEKPREHHPREAPAQVQHDKNDLKTALAALIAKSEATKLKEPEKPREVVVNERHAFERREPKRVVPDEVLEKLLYVDKENPQ